MLLDRGPLRQTPAPGHAIHQACGWPVSLISPGSDLSFPAGVFVVANLAALHRRLGLVAVMRMSGVAVAFGFLGWTLAQEP